MKNILKLVKLILFEKKIILLSSQLQLINFRELIYINKPLNKILDNVKILIIADNENDKRFKNIQKILNLYLLKNQIIIINSFISIKLGNYLVRLRNFLLSSYDLIIIGNFFSRVNQEFIKKSKKNIILDDGSNIFRHLPFNNFNSKNIFFSFFDKNLLQVKNYENNGFLYLKNKYKKKINCKDIYILGSSFVQNKLLTQKEYIIMINKIINKFKIKKFFYLAHPHENIAALKKIKNLNFIKTTLPIELYFIKKKYNPKLIISMNSSAAITLKLISERFKIINITLKDYEHTNKKKKNSFSKWQMNFKKYTNSKKIKNYNISLK